MYYRKYFEGTVVAGTATVTSLNGIGNLIQLDHTEKLNRAMEEILTEIGMACQYDPENYVLTVEGCEFNLFVRNNLVWSLMKKGIQGSDLVVSQVTSSTYSPFSGTNYKFYITVRGEPEGLLEIYIGSYSNSALTSYGFQVGFGKDIRDNSDVVFSAAATGNSYYIQEKGGGFPEGVSYNSAYAFSRYLTKDAGLSKDGSLIPIIEIFADCGFFKMNHCYFSSNELVAKNFYNIGGEIYFSMNQFILVKCFTELPE